MSQKEQRKLKHMITDLQAMNQDLSGSVAVGPPGKLGQVEQLLQNLQEQVARLSNIPHDDLAAIRLRQELRQGIEQATQILDQVVADDKIPNSDAQELREILNLVKRSLGKPATEHQRPRRGRSVERPRSVELVYSEPANEGERAFMTAVDSNRAQQDVILGQISNGLDDLQALANTMNTQLSVQEVMLGQVEEEIDDAQGTLERANRKIKGLLDRSGGSGRWIVVILLTIILLSLVAVIV